MAREIRFELPKRESRRDIFEGQRNERWDDAVDAVDTATLADQTDGWNSADIIEAFNEARRLRGKARTPQLTMEHLEATIESTAQQKAAKEPRKVRIGFVHLRNS